MIKIERIACESATITRGDEQIALFEGQILHGHDLESLKVVDGELVYSVDELELVTVTDAVLAKVVAAKSATKAA
jgi:hypothetical protein